MSSYTPRLEAPTTDNRYYYADNVFYQAGYGMPNCTCYAWGRFYEVTGERPTLGTGDAETWFSYPDGYARGTSPKLGAVMVWAKGSATTDSDGAGHVAIVERMNNDGTITTSESYYGGAYFSTVTYSAPYSRSGQTFLGFIYCPIEFDYQPPTIEPISAVSRPLTRTEMENNALYIYYYLSARGWSMNAIAGILGNMELESTINPGRWQNDNIGVGPAVGLVQWDPFSKYINWCNANGLIYYEMDSGLQRILWELENREQYYATANYPETFAEFTTSTKSANYLGWAFVYNYERPANPTAHDRGAYAEKWYNFLMGYPGGVVPKPPIPREKLPIWLLFKMAEKRRF